MPKIFTIAKKVIQQVTGGGGITAAPSVTAGISITSKVTGVFTAAVSAGISMAQSAIFGTMAGAVGTSITGNVSGNPNLQQLASGIALSTVGDFGRPQIAEGVELVQVKFDLTHTGFATTAASTGSWTNPTNAQGANNGTNASNANTLTQAASGALTLSYAAQPNRTDLVISSVNLSLYSVYSPGALTPCTYLIEYSLNGGGAYTTLATGTNAFTLNGNLFDITAAVGGDWSKIANLKVRFTLTGGASATPSTLTVDAAAVIAVASRTDTI